MEEKREVPYVVHEGMLARQERTIKRLWILCIILIFTLIGTNGAWLYYESQLEDEVITQEISQRSGNGDNSYNGKFIGGDYYGESEDKDYNTETET